MGLRPFKKGPSGDPVGKPKGFATEEMSVERLVQLYALAHDKRQSVAVRILAWKVIMERGFGKAVQPVALGLEALIRYSVTTNNRKFCSLGGSSGAGVVILDVETKELVSAVPGARHKRQEQFKKRPCRSGLCDFQGPTMLDVSMSFAYW